jgi:pyruvate dehydrogenase E1 component beta subunit
MRLDVPPRLITRPDGAIVGASPELDVALLPNAEQLITAIMEVFKAD